MSKNPLSRILLAAFTLTCLTCTVNLIAQTPKPPSSPSSVVKRLRYTVTPSKLTPIAIRTLPDALCKLRAEDSPEKPDATLIIFADEEGVARFFVRPKKELDRIARVAVECTQRERTTTHVELRASFTPTKEMPAPPRVELGIPKNAPIRPALKVEEALQLSDQELTRRGYPLPPDQRLNPQAYDAWIRNISSPIAMIAPRVRPNPYIRRHPKTSNGLETSNTWSGIELRNNPGSFAWLQGQWTIPTVLGDFSSPAATTYSSSTWVGIDGDGLTDLVQGGSEQNALSAMGGFIEILVFDVWTELIPAPESVISNFVIHPGDVLFVQMQIADAGGSPNLAGHFAYFFLSTLSAQTQVYVPLNGMAVTGSEAEWIVERASHCPNGETLCTPNDLVPWDLANYSTIEVSFAMARAPNAASLQGYVNCCDPGSTVISMVNGSDTLSKVSVIASGDMRFTWSNFH